MTILLIVNLIIAIMTGNFLYAGQESGVPYFCTPLLNNYKGLKVEKAEEVEMKEKSAAAEVAGGATELNDFINQELRRSEDWVKRDYTVVFEKIKNTKQNLFLDFLEKLEKVHNCNDRQKKEKKANALRAELVRAILAYNEKEKFICRTSRRIKRAFNFSNQ
jgi:hypothetical protein